MQVLQHTMAHRGASATRTNARWHPYTPPRSSGSCSTTPHHANVHPTPSAHSAQFQYLNTPSSTVYSVSPTDVSQRISPAIPHPHPPSQCAGPAPLLKQTFAKSQQQTKQTYVAQLVGESGISYLDDGKAKEQLRLNKADQAVRSLSDIWRPEGIPAVFATNTRITVSSPPPPPTPTVSRRNPLVRRLSLQLPSPCSPSTSLPSPTVSSVCSQQSTQQFTAGQSYISSTTVITEKELVPIRAFVHEVLRRSRTTCSVLQSALCYIEAIRKRVPELVEQERQGLGVRGEVDLEDRIVVGTEDEATYDSDATPSGNDVPTEIMHTQPYDENDVATVLTLDASTQPMSETRQNAADLLSKRRKIPSKPLEPLPPLPSPLLCPRRAFLAALILASKFLQDRCYSNRAWAKLSGLPPREVSRCERALGDALEWRLWVGKNGSTSEEQPSRPVLRSRSEGFIACTPSPSQSLQIPSPPMSDAGASPEISRVAPPTLQRRSPQALRRASTAPDLYRNPYPLQSAIASTSTSAFLADDVLAGFYPGLSAMPPPQVTVTQPPMYSSMDLPSFATSQDFSSLSMTDDHTPRLGHSPASLPESNLDTPNTQYSTTIWSPTYSAGSTENGLSSLTTPPHLASIISKQLTADLGCGFLKNELSTSPESSLCFNPGSWVSQQATFASIMSSHGFASLDAVSQSGVHGN